MRPLPSYAALFHGAPTVTGATDIGVKMIRHLNRIMKGEKLSQNLRPLLAHAQAGLDRLEAQPGHVADLFDEFWRTVYHLTMRTVGCVEIAADERMLARTLSIFESIERAGDDSARITFPWLPTPGHLKRLWAGGQMYVIFNDILQRRKREGRREEDAFQIMIDDGDSAVEIVTVRLPPLIS